MASAEARRKIKGKKRLAASGPLDARPCFIIVVLWLIWYYSILFIFIVTESKKSNIKELIELAQKGDAQAFALIYDQFVKPIYRFIYFRVDPQIAEDLTEETFLKAWQHLPSYKVTGAPFSAWLYKIAHNLVCDYYRKHQIVDEVDENMADPIQNRDPVFQVNVRFNQIRIRKAILKLPESHQQVIVLKYINDLNNQEIATTIGKSEGTVRTIQFRALRQLRQILDAKLEDF